MLPLPALQDICQALAKPAETNMVVQVAAACGVRRLTVKHLELHLDWSLLDERTCSADSAVAGARRRLAAAMLPLPRPLPAPMTGLDSPTWPSMLAALAGSPICLPADITGSTPEAPPAAVLACLDSLRAPQANRPRGAAGASMQQACSADHVVAEAAPGPVADVHPLAASGVFAGRKRKKAPRCQQAAGGEAAFFARLQRDSSGAATCHMHSFQYCACICRLCNMTVRDSAAVLSM